MLGETKQTEINNVRDTNRFNHQRNPKSSQRWRQKTNFDTNTTSEQLFPNRIDCYKLQLDALGENGELAQNKKQINKNQPIHQNNVPSTSLMKQMFTNMPSRGLGRICSRLPARGTTPQNELQYRENHKKKHSETYICVLATRVAFWPLIASQDRPKATRRITWINAHNDQRAATTTLHF